MRRAIKDGINKDVDSCMVVAWYKKVGERVKKGEVVVHYEDMKGDVDIEADADGILVEILFEAGADISRPPEKRTGPWDAVFGWIETGIDISESKMKVSPLPEEPPKERTPEAKEEKIERKESLQSLRHFVRASSLVRQRAREWNIDLSNIQGTGPGGMILLKDIEHAREILSLIEKPISGTPPPVREEETKEFTIVVFDRMAQAIAENMQSSWDCIPHAGSLVRINFWNVIQGRKKVAPILQEKLGREASRYLRFDIIVIEGIIRALSDAFRYRQLNSCYGCTHFDFKGLKAFKQVNLGIAYDHPAGLVVPVLSKIEGSSYRVIAERLDDLYARLKGGRVKPSEFRGGTITFNNVGVFGADGGESIIVHGQSCIVSFQRLDLDENSPLYGYAGLHIRFDHRAHTRGSMVIGFLVEVKKFIEEVDFESHVLSQF